MTAPPRPGSSRKAAPTTRPISASRPGCSVFRPRPRTRRLAWDLAAFLCNPEASTKLVAYPDSGIQPSRTKTIEDPQPLIDAGMDPTDAKQYLEGIGKAVGHPNAVLDLPFRAAANTTTLLDVEASRFMAGEISAEQAMKNAADGWNETTDRLGRDNQAKLYKAALWRAEIWPAPRRSDAAPPLGGRAWIAEDPKRSIVPVAVHHAGIACWCIVLTIIPLLSSFALRSCYWDFGEPHGAGALGGPQPLGAAVLRQALPLRAAHHAALLRDRHPDAVFHRPRLWRVRSTGARGSRTGCGSSFSCR